MKSIWQHLLVEALGNLYTWLKPVCYNSGHTAETFPYHQELLHMTCAREDPPFRRTIPFVFDKFTIRPHLLQKVATAWRYGPGIRWRLMQMKSQPLSLHRAHAAPVMSSSQRVQSQFRLATCTADRLLSGIQQVPKGFDPVLRYVLSFSLSNIS